jgi:hypothetical protein
LRAWISATRTGWVEVRVIDGSAPPPAPPVTEYDADHVTLTRRR